MMPQSIYPLPRALDRAFDQTERIILETDIDAINSPAIQQQILTHGLSRQGLAKEIKPNLYLRLKRHLADHALPAQFCDALTGWLCALSLEVTSFQLAGMSPDAGIDRHFANRARAAKRKLEWLEAPLEQLALFFDLDPQMSEQFLESTLEDLGKPALQPKQLVQIWLNNDVAALNKTIADLHSKYPQVHDQLLAKRNRNWADQLDTILGVCPPALVIVGAGHLVGPDNLIELLRSRGFNIRPAAEPSQQLAQIDPLPTAPTARRLAAASHWLQ